MEMKEQRIKEEQEEMAINEGNIGKNEIIERIKEGNRENGNKLRRQYRKCDNQQKTKEQRIKEGIREKCQ